MATDRRLAKDVNLLAVQLERIVMAAEFLRKNLPDVQSLAWDQPAPDSNYPAVEPGENPPPTKADRARELIRALRSGSGINQVEAALNDFARDTAKLFVAPKADDSMRGTLLGETDSEGRFMPHSPNLEMLRLLAAQRRREARAPRTGEIAHERLEAQPRAPKAPGEDPNLRRPA